MQQYQLFFAKSHTVALKAELCIKVNNTTGQKRI